MNLYLHNKIIRGIFVCVLTFCLGGLTTFAAEPLLINQQLNKMVTINVTNASVRSVIYDIQKQTKLNIIIHDDGIDLLPSVTINLKDRSAQEALYLLFRNTLFTYKIKDDVVAINKREVLESEAKQGSKQPDKVTMNGQVVSDKEKPVVGVTIMLLGTTSGAITDEKGNFVLTGTLDSEIEISCVGYKTIRMKLRVGSVKIVIEPELMEVDDVVVTGIYTRKSESFTGSYASFTSKDIKSVGGTNVLQALKTLDPAFNMKESNEFGSDPNRLPDIEIRGKSSILGTKDELAADPNQPLFILDGFESSLTAIYNLDVNRILSITILKDAASTAIYGSKAANGVVVVETVKPTPGKLRLSYEGSATISAPDLGSYHLMNAPEKLQFELLAGKFSGFSAENNATLMQIYNKRMQSIAEGVDTYWLAEPLRVGVNHRHSVYVQGGDENFTFTAGGSYNGITGVMKESKRDNLTGNLDLTYRKNKFQFSNKFTIESIDSADPVVSFSTYAQANPYYRKYNENGESEVWLEYIKDIVEASNPLYNASLNSRNESKNMVLTNYFSAIYNLTEQIRFSAKFGMTKNIHEGESFYSPLDTKFSKIVNELERGSYMYTNTKLMKYEGDLSVTYGAVLAEKHQVNLVAGGNISSDDTILQGYDVYGFPSGDFAYPSFSKGFREGETPRFQQSLSRQVSLFVNGGYSYDKRYLLDVSYRLNGSSVFGSSKRFANTWAVGLAWNVHNEKFMRESQAISLLKIRASIGNPGNQNFNSFMTYSTFAYSYNAFNYFGMSSYLTALGNPDLKWQTTLDKNIGFDLTIADRRVNINFDYYNKVTDPLLINIDYPSSSGLGQQTYYTNLGKQISSGVNATVLGYLIYRPTDRFTWSLRANFRWETAKLDNIGNKLSTLNNSGQSNRTLVRYYDGADPNDLWAVPSKGIDPATGREVFIKKDGTFTYDFDYKDEVIMGNSRPTAEGVIGTGLSYKGFSLDINFRYKVGADNFNNVLFTKVENISAGMLNTNQDKRALYDRWQSVGQEAKYKDIANSASTPISSRFIQRENTLSLESLRIGYELPAELVNSWGFTGIRINAYMNDVFRLSTVKAERGLSYPFARSFNVSLSINF